MKTRRIALSLLVALTPSTLATLSALPRPAMAQTADDATTTMARARFKEGVEFYDKGEFDQARGAFLQAYALKKHPAVLLNLAWSCLKSGHALEAKKYFEQFLAEGKDISDKQRADANDGLTQSRAKLGRIEIQAPAGTEVLVDGERVGTAPLPDPVAVEPGGHTVKFKGPDGATDTQSVSVLGGQKASARFGGPAAPSAPAPTPAPAPAPASVPATPPAATPATEATATPPAAEPSTESHGGGALAPPANLVPVFVLGGVAVAGFVTSIAMLVIKQSAQNNANDVAAKITANGGGAGTCSSDALAADPQHTYADACNAYTTDLNDVNTDATVGNIALGVGIAGALGAVIYWVAARKDGGAAAAASTTPVVMPTAGRNGGGLAVVGSF